MDTFDTKIKLHFTHLPKETREALEFLVKQTWLREQKWYLAGGTALALQCGHRTSVDLDFFTSRKDLNLVAIINALSPDWITTNREKDTLYGELKRAKVSFISYPYFVSKQPFIEYQNIQVLDARDIAVMKIIAISQRGRKRDFVDLYWYIKNREPLLNIIKRVDSQYPNLKHNYHHILKSLTYFEEAEEDPNPHIFFNATWEQIKTYFLTITPEIVDKLL